jgi:hypothetical protein
MHLPRCEQVLESETIACPCCQGQLHKIGRGEVGSRRTFFTIEQGVSGNASIPMETFGRAHFPTIAQLWVVVFGSAV